MNFGAFSRTVGLSHTPNGRLAGITYPDGTSVVYRYDGAGRLSELEHPGGVMRYSAYQWQRATRVELPGDRVRREAFDALQRSTRIEVGTNSNATAVMNHRYTYNAVGNITQKATLAGPTSYAYDALDRLTQATPPASSGLPVEGYTYDAVHNRQSSAHQPGPWSYNGNHELTQWGEGANATRLEYDANGNLVRETRGSTTRTFVYDLFDRLIEIRDNEQPIARYAWDPFARRVKKELIQGGTSTTTWTLSIQRGVLAEYDASGTLQADWQWEPDAPWSTGPVAQRTRNGETLRSHQIHTDHLWTPVALTDAQGTVAWRAIKEAFGAPIIEAGATVSTPWRFPGQYADAETGLSWNLWRHYDPRTGRYTQADPIGIQGGLNVFVYAKQSPSRLADPLGLSPFPNPHHAPRQCWNAGDSRCCITPQGQQCSTRCECKEPPPEDDFWITIETTINVGWGDDNFSISGGTAVNVNPRTGEVCVSATSCNGAVVVGALGGLGGGAGFSPGCGKDLGGPETCFTADVAYRGVGGGGSLCYSSDSLSGNSGVHSDRFRLNIGMGAAVGIFECDTVVLGCANTPCNCD